MGRKMGRIMEFRKEAEHAVMGSSVFVGVQSDGD